MKQESFCIVGVPPSWPESVPGIETFGAWTDAEGKRHLDSGRLIHHSVMNFDDVLALAKCMGEQSIVSVDTRGFANLVWTDGRKPEMLGKWQEVQVHEVVDRRDYTSFYDDEAGYQRFFTAGTP